jgi:hypothetical protein
VEAESQAVLNMTSRMHFKLTEGLWAVRTCGGVMVASRTEGWQHQSRKLWMTLCSKHFRKSWMTFLFI